MAVLDKSEYDISYFDGAKSSLTHNAGFTRYERWRRFEGTNSTGEFWKDKCANWINHLALSGKKVLELACAKGFIVKDLRDAGVDAIGMDASSYAISQCEEGVAPYLIQGDVRTDLTQFLNKQFDVVLSFRLIECLTDAEVTKLATDCQRIGKKQVHIITTGTHLNNQYYNYHTLQEWLNNFNWSKGTVLADYNDENNYVTK